MAKARDKIKKIIFFVALILIVFSFDRFTKHIASFSNYCRLICIRYSTNSGAAFSLFSQSSFIMPVLIIVSAAVLIITAFFYFKTKKFSLLHIGLVLLFSGTLGNLFDRIVFRYVIDFITFGFYPIFPAFNIADTANVAGVLLLIIYLIKRQA